MGGGVRERGKTARGRHERVREKGTLKRVWWGKSEGGQRETEMRGGGGGKRQWERETERGGVRERET